MKKHYRKENNCLNCGTELEGKYCHNCGQENLEIKESFGHMMNHAISDYFHFDHQFFHTIKPLLFKPGYLTNEYMAGRRAQYLHPVKMYIFISVVYFLLLFQSGAKLVSPLDDNASPATTQKAIDSAKKEIATNPDISAADKKALQDHITSYNIAPDKNGKSKGLIIAGDSTVKQYTEHQNKLPPDKRDAFFDRKVNEKLLAYHEKYGDRWGEEFGEQIGHNLPKMMFVLLPLFALFLGITFRKSQKFYVEHLIYTLHLFCFLFLFFGIIIIIDMAVPNNWKLNGWLSLIGVLLSLLYFYKSLKLVYHRSRFRTITKLAGITLSFLIAYMVCFVLMILLTAVMA